jgi:glycosyltransferase involved in cell wall biosynthesis
VKTLLFLSYYFPPLGGAGAQRPLKMVRYLERIGYRSHVLTGPGPVADRWAPVDQTLGVEVPEQTAIHRLPGPEPLASGGWRGRGERWLTARSPWEAWWIEGAVEAGRGIAPGTDLIYAWMQPYSSAHSAARLSSETGLPWVADLGDPWALDEMMVYPSRLHRRRELHLMRRLLGTASAIVMSTPEAAGQLVEHIPELAAKPVVVIPNGFDGSDFAAPAPKRQDDRFRIVHTGYLHTQLGRQQQRGARARRVLGGTINDVDIYTRSHVFLLQAVERVRTTDPELAAPVEIHLAGVLTDSDRVVVGDSGLVHLHGYVTHAESIELMRTADLLFLPMQNLPAGTPATIVPGKTYEYLASGTPILGAVPDGDARDILAAAGNASIVRPDDVEAMAEALREHLRRFRDAKNSPAPDPEVVAGFEYAHLAGKLADVFDSVLDEAEASPAERRPAEASTQ